MVQFAALGITEVFLWRASACRSDGRMHCQVAVQSSRSPGPTQEESNDAG